MRIEDLPDEDGFRLRGQSVTRLETFVDAAFAFALTLLVIAGDTLPASYAGLREALWRIPTFVACFALVAMFWSSHNRWSRRFGLEDAWSTLLSMALVLAVLVFVYPLRIVVASGLHVMTGGRVPSDIAFSQASLVYDTQTAFITYGVGFGLLSLILLLLNRHALARAGALGLDPLERLDTRTEIGIHALLAGSAGLSVLLSAGMLAWADAEPSPGLVGLPMFTYPLLAVVIPLYVGRQHRQRRRLRAAAGA